MLYKILTDRFAEWKRGDVAAIDDEAATVPLEKGEIIPYEEPKPKNTGIFGNNRGKRPTKK